MLRYAATPDVRKYVKKYMKARHMSPRAFESIALSGLGYEGCTIHWGSCSNELVLVSKKNQYDEGPPAKLHVLLLDRESDSSYRTDLAIPADTQRGYDFYEMLKGHLLLSVKERHFDNHDYSIKKVMDYRISEFTEIKYTFETEKLSDNVILSFSVRNAFEESVYKKEKEITNLLKVYNPRRDIIDGENHFERLFESFKKLFYFPEVPFSFFLLEVTGGGDADSPKHQILAKNGAVTSYTRTTNTGVKYCLSSSGKWTSVSDKWSLTVQDGNYDYGSTGKISDVGPNQNDVLKIGIEETQRMHKIMCW